MNLWERFYQVLQKINKRPIISCRSLLVPMIGYERHPDGTQIWTQIHNYRLEMVRHVRE